MTQITPLAELLRAVSDYLSEGDTKSAVEKMIAIREAGFATTGLERHVRLLNASPGDITSTRAWVDKALARVESEGDVAFEEQQGLAEGSMIDIIGAAADDIFGDDLFGDDDLFAARSNSFAAEASTRRVTAEDAQKLRESSDSPDESLEDGPSLKERLRITAGKFRIPMALKSALGKAEPENLHDTRPNADDAPADKQTKPFGEPAFANAKLDDPPTNLSRSVTPLQAVPAVQRQSREERDPDEIMRTGVPEITPNVFNRRQETHLTPNAAPAVADDEFDFDLGFESKPATFGPATKSADEDEFSFDLGLSAEPAAPKVSDPEFTFDLGLSAEPAAPKVSDSEFTFDLDSAHKPEIPTSSDADFELEFTVEPPSKSVTPARSSDGFDFDFAGGGVDSRDAVKTKPTSSGGKADAAKTAIPHPGRAHQLTPLAMNKAAIGEEEFFELADSMSSEANPYRGEPIHRGAPSPSRANTFNRDNKTGVRATEPSFVLEDLGSPESSVLGPSTNMSAILLEARRMYERGEFSAALDICTKVMSRQDGHEEAQQLRMNIEGELVRTYIERLGSLNRIPRVTIDLNDVGTLNLDHRAGFILSQIDGMSSYEDLLELASMARHEALKLFVRLLDVGATSDD